MSLKPWIQAPVDFKEWGTRFNAWMKDLVTYQARQDGLITTLNTNIRVTPASYQVLQADVFLASFTLDLTAPYGPSFSYVDESGLVTHAGLARNLTGATVAAGANLAIVRPGFRPATSTFMLPVACSVPGQFVYIAPTGLVTTELAIPAGGYISLCWSYRIF